MVGARFAAVLLWVTAAASPAFAQNQKSTPPGNLTIAGAIDEAIQHNLPLIAERANLGIADAAMITARLRPNPVASVSADHLDWLGTGFNDVNNGGPPEVAWRFDIPFERGGKRDARMAVASVARSAAEAQLADAIRILRQDVTATCIDVFAARATNVFVTETLRSFEEIVRVNQRRVAAGSIAPLESTRGKNCGESKLPSA